MKAIDVKFVISTKTRDSYEEHVVHESPIQSVNIPYGFGECPDTIREVEMIYFRGVDYTKEYYSKEPMAVLRVAIRNNPGEKFQLYPRLCAVFENGRMKYSGLAGKFFN